MNFEEKEKIINDGIDVIDDTDASDCHLFDYQRKIKEDFTKYESIIGRKWLDIYMWAEYIYRVIYGVMPTYNELLEFADDVLMSSREVKTESSILSFYIGIPKERTITDVKKDIKHEKNPMRLKQLNKELNKLYKENKRKKKGEEKDE